MSLVYGILKRYEKPDRTELLSMSGESDAGHTLYKSAGWGRAFERKGLLLQWDGDIHNRKDLCRELGLPLDASDEDIVLDGTARHGTDFFGRINGSFALALLDRKSDTWTIARGPQGLKPLYYFQSSEGFAFSRDLSSLFRLPWVTGEPHWERIPEYLVFNHTAGGDTLYRDVKELLPGCILSGDLSGAILHKKTVQWHPSRSDPEEFPPDDLKAASERMLTRSVERLWDSVSGSSSGRKAFFLTGGVDSTLIAGVLHSLASPEDLYCLTITCRGYKHDEAAYAKTVRDRYGFPGGEIDLDPDLFSGAWSACIRDWRLPLTSTNQVPWWVLCKKARGMGLGSVFSGEGADGWYAGGWYDDEREAIEALWDSDPAEAENRSIFCRTHCLNDPDIVRSITNLPLDVSGRKRLFTQVKAHVDAEGGFRKADPGVLYQVRTTGNRLLTRADRSAEAHGRLQLKLPFLDREWIRCMQSVPYTVRNKDGIRKYPLKSLAAERFGEEFAFRRKIGFTFPIRTWIRDAPVPLFEDFRELLLDKKTLNRKFYRKDALKEAVSKRLDGRQKPADWLLWSLINVELWLRDCGY